MCIIINIFDQILTNMDNLLSYQIPHVEKLAKSIINHNRALDASDTGTGKTYTSVALCEKLNLRPFIIAPLSVLASWKTVLDNAGIKYYGLTNYESLKNCKWYTKNNPDKKTNCKYIKRYKISNENTDKYEDYDDGVEIMPKKSESAYKYSYEWKNIPANMIVIFDEAHRCKNKRTINSILLHSLAINSDAKILLLSATISDKPEKFTMAGFVLGLYKNLRQAKSWISKCNVGFEAMAGVHAVIFDDYGSRMRIKDLADLFPKNKVIAQCYDMENAPEIEEQYKIIEDEVERLKNNEEMSGCPLAAILYARMRIEQLKIPTMINLTKQYVSKGISVTIFVNFTNTLQTLADELDTTCVVYGDQTMDERNRNIKMFNINKSKIIICNIKSGGVGISLHDTLGNNRRISIISPSDSAQDILQTLGRIHRANGKTEVEQYIIYCKGTVEVKICENMKQKISNISSINDGNCNTYNIEGLTKSDSDDSDDGFKNETDRILARITVLNLKKNRLEQDLFDTNNELKSLIEILNSSVL